MLNMDKLGNIDKEKYNRSVVCWKCQATILINNKWKDVKCPLCNELNVIPEYKILKPNVNLEQNSQNYLRFVQVTCPFCGYKMRTRRESEFIICSMCKNTVIIIKDQLIVDPLVNPMEYLKFKLDPIFNPYLRITNTPYYLSKNSSKTKENLTDKKKSNEVIDKKVNLALISKYEVYKPLSETIKEITENINKLNFTSPQPKMSRIGEIAKRNFIKEDNKNFNQNMNKSNL